MNFDPEKLETSFIPPATPYSPVNGRKYTLTHSDITGMLFLDIGEIYNYEVINENLRDELLGKYQLLDDNSYILFFYAYVGDSDFETASKRYNIFKSHLEGTLLAIIYGDTLLFQQQPHLINTPIFVKFDSKFPSFDKYESYGYISDYLLI